MVDLVGWDRPTISDQSTDKPRLLVGRSPKGVPTDRLPTSNVATKHRPTISEYSYRICHTFL